MRSVIWFGLASILVCVGLAGVASSMVQATDPNAPSFARKVPRPPECPDCGIGAKITQAE